MGNAASSSESDDDQHSDYKDEDASSDGELELDKDASPTIDLQSLFDHTLLRAAASKVKDDMPENVVQQHHAHLLVWLEERQKRSEDTVTLAQFCDFLMSRSVGREEALQAFKQFDTEGDGTADVATMQEALKNTNSANMAGELAYVVRTLQACSLTPGFIDVYNEDKQDVGQHGQRILNFLLRNRAPSTSIPFPILNGFNNTVNMRVATVKNHFNKLKDAASRQQVANMLSEGEEMKTITRCWKSIEVSTNKADAHRLTNGEFSSFWQSDGSARSHWIRLRMRNNVVIKQLSVVVAASDQSYMPQLISVAVGKNAHSLHEIKDVRFPSTITGEVVLLENLKTYYPVIQLNIKRCHSDGCDTRIHEVKTLGYRIMKENTVSVMDASASWFLQVLASTATAAIPIAPSLRTNILQHSKSALQHMPPLSLCPASSDRPQVLSAHVLKEVDRFLNDISRDDCLEVQEDALYVLLAFNLACGNVAGVLGALQCLQEHKEFQLEAGHLLRSLTSVRNTFWKKQSGPVALTLAGCDGGQKEETSGPQNVLTGNWTTAQAYLSGDDKTRVNMFFKAHDHIQVTKVRVKVEKGPRGPKCGMIFVYNDSETFDLDKHIERFKKYDTWTAATYGLAAKCRSAGITKDPDAPLAYFTLEDDWDETEISMDTCPVGQYILVKFLEPRQASVERLGIVGIKFHGFNRKSIFVDKDNLHEAFVIPDGVHRVDSKDVFFWTLHFLVSLARDHIPQKPSTVNPRPQSLDVSEVSIERIWKIYNCFSNKIHQNLVLQLLHALFPFLVSDADKHRDASEKLFQYLCHLVDHPAENSADIAERHLLTIARQVIIDGAAVFFPDKEARRKQLFNMMADINGTAEVSSVSLVFQSLCQFFGSVDPSGLLDLPINMEKPIDPAPVLAVMETLVSVAAREFHKVLLVVEVSSQASHLVQLLCSLQTALLCWCHRQITSEEKDYSALAQEMLVKYVQLLINKTNLACQDFQRRPKDEMITVISKLEGTFLSTTVRQLVLILMLLGVDLLPSTRVGLLKILMPFGRELHAIGIKLPQHFYTVESEHWESMDGSDVVLRTWEVESGHNYENNLHITQIFSCPGAATFTVEFDPRCETEKRYDYLEFTDSRGAKVRYDQKVCTEKWPMSVTFKSGHRLQFHFHSDSSNNEWGYKFKVIATGTPDVPLCWMFDLQLGLAKLLGQLCGATLGTSTTHTKRLVIEDEEDPEMELLKSDLWATVFRGGYRTGKELKWSLSRIHIMDVKERFPTSTLDFLPPMNSLVELFKCLGEAAVEGERVLNLLWSMINKESGEGATLLSRCQEQVNAPQMGGEDMNNAVIAVFAALLWHTQILREELDKIEEGKMAEVQISDGIIQTYNIAESLRRMLMAQRQAQKAAAEKSGVEADVIGPVTNCVEKAKFLLRFAGLQRIHIKSNSKTKLHRQSSRYARLPHAFKTANFESTLDKYPSFRLVLEFVRDPAWCKSRVEELLKERTRRAEAVADVYRISSEYVRCMSQEHIFQVPTVLFLQQLLSYQDGFPRHYADGLDGCGLELEANIRQAYYSLIRQLVGAIGATHRIHLSRPVMAAFDYTQACTLHLLDVDWHMYDLSFLGDIKLPELYMKLAKGSVSTREKIVSEPNKAEELVEYKKDMTWLEECKKDFMEWYKRTTSANGKDAKKATQMFVAKFCDLLEVEVNCDGCGVTLPGRRYRCLQCEDMDLCAMCYAGGVKPGGEHTDDHDIVHMMYKCDECQAFIVGTRLHCKVCDDFDLCLGCHEKKQFPAGHSEDHDMETYPMIKLKLSKDSDSSLQSYIHQHVWLRFTSLSLSLGSIMYSDTVRGGQEIHAEYIKACTQLHNMCIELANSCLRKVTSHLDEPDEEDTPELRQEEAFASHAQERITGLLGAMIPPENKLAISEEVCYTFTSESFMMLLFQIASGESGHETNTQHLAMGLIGQLLQRTTVSCSTVDTAVALATDSPIPEDASNGAHTAKYLFSFGATCLERSGLEWASSVASILQRMFKSPSWRGVLLRHLTTSIQKLKEQSSMDHLQAPKAETEENRIRYKEMFLKADKDKKGYVTEDDLKGLLQPELGPEKWKSFWAISRCVQICYADKAGGSLQPIRKLCDREDVGQMTEDQFCLLMMLTEKKHGAKNKNLVKKDPDISEPPVGETSNDKAFVLEVSIGENPPLSEKKGPELSSIFALFVIAGFPEVLSIGAPVRYTDYSTEYKKGVVLKHFPDKYQTLLVDRKTRRRKTKKDEYVEVESSDMQVLDQQHICAFIEVIKDITAKIKQGAYTSVENVWVLSLTLKALLKTLQGGLETHVLELFALDFVQSVIYLASQGTGFSKQWLLKDLEILSLMLYTRDQERPEEISDTPEKKKMSDDEGSSSCEESYNDPWQGLDNASAHCFKTLHEHLGIPVSILRAIHDMHGRNADALLMAVHEHAGSTGIFVPSDEIKMMARKWEVHPSSSHVVDKTVDTGMQLQMVEADDESHVLEVAKEEPSDESQKLISDIDPDMSSEAVKQRKSRSALLLKKELENQGKTGSREFLHKVNMAMAVLYARHVLMKLLADWPPNIPLQIGCKEDSHIPFILDLLNRYDSQDTFQKVVRNVIACYSVDCVVPIAKTACQFLEEVNLSSIVKESEHSYKNNTNFKDTVTIPGVSFLSIHFDGRCCTEENCDELVMASNPELSQSRRVFSGPEEHWIDFVIAGDTLYYKFESDGSTTDWGYRFTVTGGRIGRFDTGYMILKSILVMPEVIKRLPVKDLWSSLIHVACKQTGQQRLKSLHLALKILQSQFKNVWDSELAIDLGLLKPLWSLYTKSSNSCPDSSSIVTPVVRALTEVFLVAENLAMEWDVSRQYIASLKSSDEINLVVFEALQNIAAVSIMIGTTNKATDGFNQLKASSDLKDKKD